MTKKALIILFASIGGAIVVGGTTTAIVVSNSTTYVDDPTADTTNFVYNGSEQTYKLQESDLYTITGNKKTDAGEYSVTVSLNKKKKYAWKSTKKSDDLIFNFTIDKKGVLEPSAGTSLFEYTGNEVTYTVTNEDSSFYTVTNNKATNAGTYNAKVSLNDAKNYKWKNSNKSDDLTLPFTISQKDVSSLIAIDDIEDMEYTGEHINPNVTLKTAIPEYEITYGENINVGKGTVTITAKGNFTGSKTFEFNIVTKKITIPTPTTTEYTYTGSEIVHNIPESGYYDILNNKAINAGNYTATLSLKDKTNTTWSDGTTEDKELTFKINPITISENNVQNINNVTYTGQELTPEVKITSGNYVLIKDTDYTLSYSDNINVGTGRVTITGKGNFTGTIFKTFTIAKKVPNVTAPTPVANLRQTGADYELVTAGFTSDGTMQYALALDGTYTATIPTGNAAGEYKVYYKVVGDDNIEDVEPQYVTVTIAKPYAEYITEPQAKDLTYDGSFLELVTAGSTDDGTIVYLLKQDEDDENFQESIPGTSEAGTYRVYYKIQADNDHDDSTVSYVDVTVKKKKVTFTTEPTAKTNLVFNDQPQELLNNDGVPSEGTIKYCLTEDGYYFTNIPKGTNAGDYTVWCFVEMNNSNYEDSDKISIPVSIAKKQVALPADDETIFTYTGEELTYNIPASDDYTVTGNKQTNAGNYTVTVSLVDKNNTTWAGTTSADLEYDFTINKASFNSATVTGINGHAYDGNPISFPNLTIKIGEEVLDNGDFTLVIKDSDNQTIANPIEVGTYTASITGINFIETYTQEFEIFIDSSDIANATIDTIADKEYTGSAITFALNVSYNNTPLTEGEDYTVSWNNNIELGQATVTINGIGNYYGSQPANFQIVPKKVTKPTEDTTEYTYSGEELTYIVTDSTYYTVTGNKQTDAGEYIVTITLKDKTHTTWNDSTTADLEYDFVIAKKEITKPAVDETVFTYTGEELTYNIPASDDYTVTGNKQTNAGEYTVTVSLVDKDNTTWNDTTVADLQYAFNIGKANPTYTAPTAKPILIFNGSEQELITAGSTNGGTMYYRLGDGEYSTSIPKATNALTYTIYFKITGDSNYNSVDEASFTVTIGQATALYITNPTAIEGLIYNGSSQTLITAGSSEQGTVMYSLSINDGYSSTLPTSTDAGNYIIYYYIKSENTNYDDSEVLSINNASIAKLAISDSTITVSTITPVTYTGNAIRPEPTITFTGVTPDKVLDNNTDYVLTYSDNVNASETNPRVIITGQGNFTGTKDVHFTISKKELSSPTITITPATYTGSNIDNPTFIAYDGTLNITSMLVPQPGTRTNAGEYTVIFKLAANSNYWNTENEFPATLTINPKAYDSSFTITVTPTEVPYTKSVKDNGATPSVLVEYNSGILSSENDYSLEYSNNNTVGENTAKVTITFKGNFSGETERTFSIVSQTFTITYVDNNQTITTQDYESSNETVQLGSTSKTGYSGEWHSAKGEFQFNATTNPDVLGGNITLTAYWTAIQYNVTYNLGDDNASNNTNNITSYNVETPLFTLLDPTYNNPSLATFEGWYDNSGFNGDPITTIAGGNTGILVLYAKWHYNEFSVTYNNMEGATNHIDNKTTVTPVDSFTLKAPTKPYYDFGGWYDNENLTGTAIESINKPTSNIVLYAKWTKHTYTITYNYNINTADYAVNNSNDATYKVGDTVSLTDAWAYEHQFNGWFTNTNYDTPFAFNTNAPTDVTVYGKFTKHNTTFTTYLNGNPAAVGGSITSDIATKKVGEQVTITITTDTGYTFDGLYVGDAASPVTTNSSYSFTLGTAAVEYRAKFSGYTLNYSSNNTNYGSVQATVGGNNVTTGTYISSGTQITLTATTHAATVTTDDSTVYVFAGWYKDNVLYDNDLSHLEITYQMTGQSINFQARWAQVTVQPNNNVYGSVTKLNSTYVAGNQVSVTATPSQNKLFLGWYVDDVQVGNTVTYQITMPSVDTIYEARFIDNNISVAQYNVSYTTTTEDNVTKYNITYSEFPVNSAPSTATATSNVTTVTYTMAPSNDYIFAGWYDSASSSKNLLSNSISYICEVTLNENPQTIYALWVSPSMINIEKNPDVNSLVYNTTYGLVSDGISFTAEDNADYLWNGWYIGNSQTTSSKTLSLTYADTFEKLVTHDDANFAGFTTTYTAKWTLAGITVAAGPNGSAKKTKDANTGKWTITATPNTGYHFDHWEKDSVEIQDSTAVMTNIADGSGSYTAFFAANTNTPYKVNYKLQNYEDNDYTIDTDLSGSFTGETGKTVSITRGTVTNYTFKEAKINGVIVNPTVVDGNIYNLTIIGVEQAEDNTLEFYFDLKTATLTYHYNNGSSSEDVLVKYNADGQHQSVLKTKNDKNEDVTWYTDFKLTSGNAITFVTTSIVNDEVVLSCDEVWACYNGNNNLNAKFSPVLDPSTLNSYKVTVAAATNIVIPDYIDDIPVNTVNIDNLFNGNTKLYTSLSMTSNLTYIEFGNYNNSSILWKKIANNNGTYTLISSNYIDDSITLADANDVLGSMTNNNYGTYGLLEKTDYDNYVSEIDSLGVSWWLGTQRSDTLQWCVKEDNSTGSMLKTKTIALRPILTITF